MRAIGLLVSMDDKERCWSSSFGSRDGESVTALPHASICWSDAFQGDGSSKDQPPWAAVVEGLLPRKGSSRALEQHLCRNELGRGKSVRSRSGQAIDRHRQWREGLGFEDPPMDVFPGSSTASSSDIKDRGMAMAIRRSRSSFDL